jgi:lactate dehydrogenase-like 2-hydroxyacid dehydrogenase
VVDEEAPVRALATRRIAGAGLDVFEAEPAISPDLIASPNVALTPHMGGSAHEALARMMEIALLNVTQVLDGAEPVCRVN